MIECYYCISWEDQRGKDASAEDVIYLCALYKFIFIHMHFNPAKTSKIIEHMFCLIILPRGGFV